MNITIYSHHAFFRYILSCVVSGAFSALLYFAAVVIFSVPGILKCQGIRYYKAYCSSIVANQSASRHITDFLCCSTIAIALLMVSFVANSGKFRILSVVMLALGFYITDAIFRKAAIVTLSFVIYLIFSLYSFSVMISSSLQFA